MRIFLILAQIITVIVAWRLSSAVVLYWAASAATNSLQGLILRWAPAAE